MGILQAKPRAGADPSAIQRQAAGEEEELELTLQAKADGKPSGGAGSPPAGNLRPARAGGRPLPDAARRYFEPRFGADFSAVRVHTGDRSDQAARSINARAYTLGSDIVFGRGEYQPDSTSGRHLLAHELTHTLQQGAVQRASLPVSDRTPGVQRYSWDEFVGDVESVGEAAVDVGESVVEGVVSAGEAVYEAGETAVGAVVEAGEAVYEAGAEAVEAIGEAAEAVGDTIMGIAREVWDWAGNLAAAVSGVVTFSGGRLVILVPPMNVCPTLPFQLPVPEASLYIPLLTGVWPISGLVNAYGTLGVNVTLVPEISIQLGPCLLHGMRIVIDPLGGNYSADGMLTVTTALGLGAELRAGVRGEVGALIIIPDPPLPIPIPLAGLEAGLAGQVRGIGITSSTLAAHLAYSGGAFRAAVRGDADAGLALDAGFGAYGQLDSLGINLCRIYWPYEPYHGETAAHFGMSAYLSVSSGGITALMSIDPVRPISFASLPLTLNREVLTDDCPLIEEVCRLLYTMGRMPSQNGGGWYGHPAPLWPGPLAGVYPRDPSVVNPGFRSGALCRGACGPDCDYCSPPQDKIVCEEMGDRHQFWVYPDYVRCGSHLGCREHDACYDWCGAGGPGGLGPLVCRRFCDLECACNYRPAQCVGWIFGGQPHDRTMVFSGQPFVSGGCRGPCPRGTGGGGEDEPPARAGGLRICLPEVVLFNRRSVGDSITHSTPQIPVWSQDLWVPYVGLVTLEVEAAGSLTGSLSAGIGAARLKNLCFNVDPRRGIYNGQADLVLPADITAMLTVRGELSASAAWFRIVDVIRAIGGLEATGRGHLATTLTASARVTCENGEPKTKVGLSLPTCLDLGFDLDATFDLELVTFHLLSKRWNLFNAGWNECWGEDTVLGPSRAGDPPDLDLSAHSINLENLLRWLLSTRGGGGGGGQPPPSGGGVPTGLTPQDPIEMRWFKPKSEYPQSIDLATLQGPACTVSGDCSDPTPICKPLYIGSGWQNRCAQVDSFTLDSPTNLPGLTGRQAGVNVGVAYYPDAGDTLTLDPTTRSGSAQSRFNRRFARHGHRLQDHTQEPDHVLDLDWNGADNFSNLWPLDGPLNQAAGRDQNLNQRITFSEGPNGPVHTDMTMKTFKQQGFHRRNPPHKYFRIYLVRRP